MPETNIGLFPDVGGGYFLGRCPGRVGEWLALTGEMIGAGEALAFGLADGYLDSARLAEAWDALGALDPASAESMAQWRASCLIAAPAHPETSRADIDHYFSMASVPGIIHALEAAPSEWARHTAATLRQRSPLMLHVVLEQIRRARGMTLADDLRMERDMVRHCFNTHHLGRFGVHTETVEGIRALAVDKDNNPKWNPARIEDVTPDMVAPFFVSPWPVHAHPLRNLR